MRFEAVPDSLVLCTFDDTTACCTTPRQTCCSACPGATQNLKIMPSIHVAADVGLTASPASTSSPALSVTREDGEVLIVVDVQNDFCPGGALEVPEGDAILPLVNGLVNIYGAEHTIFTQDWHPGGHASFASSHAGKNPYDTTELEYGTQTLWPDHCVQGSKGAQFHEQLVVPSNACVVRKGDNIKVDSYSAFTENDQKTLTGLADVIKSRGYTKVSVVGLAFDFCVRWTAEDAAACEGVTRVRVFRDATRSVGLPGTVESAEESLAAKNVVLETCASS